MRIYWKVHIDNFDSFIEYILNEYKNIEDADKLFYLKYDYNYYTDYENRITSEYLYLCLDKNYKICYLFTKFYDYENKLSLESDHFKYMGDFNVRKEKLKKLKFLSET